MINVKMRTILGPNLQEINNKEKIRNERYRTRRNERKIPSCSDPTDQLSGDITPKEGGKEYSVGGFRPTILLNNKDEKIRGVKISKEGGEKEKERIEREGGEKLNRKRERGR